MTTQSDDEKQTLVAVMLEELRKGFIADLPGHIGTIEALTIELENKETFVESFKELFRMVHSLKGNGGCYGFDIITHVCHGLENHLNKLNGDYQNMSTSTIDACLEHIDFLKRIATTLESGQSTDTVFNDFRNYTGEQSKAAIRCLFVDRSSSAVTFYQKALEDFDLSFEHAPDALSALNLMQVGHFDAVVTSHEVGFLNGISLIAAYKLSFPESKTKTILVTSSKELSLPEDKIYAPDFLILKGRNTLQDIKDAFAKI